MTTTIWTRLGIEPTGDLLAIKRAYAVRLKRTRPDDDAQAYQALREAYEQAQQWARWHAQDAVLTAEPEQPEPSPLAPSEPQAPAQPTGALFGPAVAAEPETGLEPMEPMAPAPAVVWVDTVTPALQALDAAWSKGGSLAVLADWHRLEALWHDVPLDERDHLNVAVVDWTLGRQTIRPELLQALAQSFGWKGDFRASRRLGWERAQALQDLMADTLGLTASNPALAARLEPLRRLDLWRTTGAVWRMLLCMVLMGEPLRQLLRDCTPAALNKLCGRDDSFEQLTQSFKTAFWLRAGLPGLLVGAWIAVSKEGWPGLPLGVFLWFALCLCLGAAVVFLGRLIGSAWGLAAQGSPLRLRVQQALAHPRTFAAGVALLTGALVLAAVPEPWPEVAPWLGLGSLLLWACGVVALWPHWPGHGFVAVGAAGLVFAIVQPWWHGQPVMALLALVSLWALVAPLVFTRGWHEGRGGWAVRMVFGFATGALSLERQGGFLFALTPMAVVATLRWADVLPAVWWGLAVWVVGMHLLSGGQALANRWAAPRLGLAST